MGTKRENEIEKEVKSLIGSTIGTIYGPSDVVGIIEREGVKYVHLREFGEEDYTVDIADWDGLIQN